MNNEKIFIDKESYQENKLFNTRLERENIYLKKELDKLKKKYDILNDKIKIYEKFSFNIYINSNDLWSSF